MDVMTIKILVLVVLGLLVLGVAATEVLRPRRGRDRQARLVRSGSE
jgi:hypothetical protein